MPRAARRVGPHGTGHDRAAAPERARRLVVERDSARRRIAEAHLEQGRQALIAGDRMRALVYLSAALGEGLAEQGARFMLERAEQAIDKQLAVLAGHTGEVRALAVDEAQGRIATGGADTTVQIWDTDSHKLSTLAGHTAEGALGHLQPRWPEAGDDRRRQDAARVGRGERG